MGWLEKFVAESNRIEGILRAPTNEEIEVHSWFLEQEYIAIDNLQMVVTTCAPRQRLRDEYDLDVRVGDFYPLQGGAIIRGELNEILKRVNAGDDPYETHRRYEILHPFTDGNGRSGRALWLWAMQKNKQLNHVIQLGFLHNWYYQSLKKREEE